MTRPITLNAMFGFVAALVVCAMANTTSAISVDATGVQDAFTRQSSSNGNNNYGTDSFLRFRQRSGTSVGLSHGSTEMSWIQYDLAANVGSITDATMYFTLDDGSGSGVTLTSGGDSFKVYLLKESAVDETTWDADTVSGLGNAPYVLPPAKTVDGGGAPTGLDFGLLDEVATFALDAATHDAGPEFTTFSITLTPAGIALLNAKTHGLATFVIANATDYDAGNTLRVRSFDNTLLGSDPNDPLAGIPAAYFPRLTLEVVPEPASAALFGAGLLLLSRRLRR